MNNTILEVKLRRAHIYDEKRAWPDGSAMAALRNHARAVELSRETVGKLPQHPPIKREKSLVLINNKGN